MKTRRYLWVCCLFLLLGAARFLSLADHWGGDETRWLHRSAEFLSAVKSGAFSETLIAHHPGVTTMWIAGLRSFFIDPGIDTENLLLARGFIGGTVWVGIGVAVLLLYQLAGKWLALASFASLAYSPLFLAQTRRVHTDALATTFLLLTVLLFLLYCQNRGAYRYLIFSGIAFGLALLSKSYSLILLLWFPVCLFLFRTENRGALRTSIATCVCFLSCTALTVFLLWPVFWTPVFGLMILCLGGLTVLLCGELKRGRCPLVLIGAAGIGLCLVGFHAIQKIWTVFDGVGWAATTPHEIEYLFFGKVANDPGWLFYPLVLTIKSTPLMLPLACLGCLLLWKQRKHTPVTARHFKTGLALVAGIVLFVVCLSAIRKKFPRYLLPVFPMLEILAAIGFIEGLKWVYNALLLRFGAEETAKYRTTQILAACVVFFFIQIMPVLALHPYYGTYYNSCWKVVDIQRIITVGDASGLDTAAKYINQKPNADQLFVQVSPLATEFFKYYFHGFAFRADRNLPMPPDYEVVYIRDSQVGRVPQAGTRGGELEARITLNGIDYVWIYRISNKETR